MFNGEALLAPFGLPPGATVVVGVSGGVDSMVLLTLLAPLQRNLRVVAAHFDHRLREGSQHEQQLVQAYATRLDVPLMTGQWAQPATTNVEAQARKARYAFLTNTATAQEAEAVIVAHHQDDQIETVLLHLARSGHAQAVAGMAKARSLGPVRLMRPLLDVPKQALYAYAETHHVPFVEDPSNQVSTFSRNRVRHEVVPALKKVNPQLLAHTGRFTQELQALQALAGPTLDALLAQATTTAGVAWAKVQDQPQAVQALLLTTVLQRWGVHVDTQGHQAILQALQQGAGTKTFTVAKGQTLTVSYGVLQDPRRSAPVAVPQPPVPLAVGWQVLADGRRIGRFDTPPATGLWAYLPTAPLVVRTRQPGDVVVFSDGRQELLRRFLINHKCPRLERGTRLVVAAGSRVYWVEGIEWVKLFQVPQTDIIHSVLRLQ